MRHLTPALLVACCLTTVVAAEDDSPRGQRGGAALRQRIIERFDENGDGKLDKAEWAKATAAMKKRRGESGQDGNSRKRPGGDARKKKGNDPRKKKGDDRKKQGNRPGLGGMAAEVFRRFDKDGDGQLNATERQAALKAREEFMKKRGGNRTSGQLPAEVLARFDKDGDGKLNEAERQAARKAREQFMKKAGGRPGPGNPAGRPSAAMLDNPQVIKRFDKDGDGELSESERAAARDAFAARGGPGAPVETQKPRLDTSDLLDKYDADGNGRLSSTERAAALRAFQDKESS